MITNSSVENLLIFNFYYQNISSAYLCNFFHAELDHLIFVNVAFWLGITLIAVLHDFESNNGIIDEKPEDLTIKSIIVIFIFLPFLISMLSFHWGRLIGIHGFNGFSGIAYAFLGIFTSYLFNASYFSIKKSTISDFSGTKKLIVMSLPLIFITTILLTIFLTDINPDTNYPAHVVGFFLGIIFGFLFLNLKILDD